MSHFGQGLLIATALAASPLAAAPAPVGDIGQINGSIVVAAGQVAGNVSTINGGIQLEDKAGAAGVHTVNGSITLGAGTAVQSVDTVNGSISVGAGGRVADAITAVNGAILLGSSADVAGRLTNVNGKIELHAAHVGGGIETVSGEIAIGAHSRIEGGIVVKKSCNKGFWSWLYGWSYCQRQLVVIGPDAIVHGPLRFEHDVKLYVSARARIGAVEGAKAMLYSGDRPPI